MRRPSGWNGQAKMRNIVIKKYPVLTEKKYTSLSISKSAFFAYFIKTLRDAWVYSETLLQPIWNWHCFVDIPRQTYPVSYVEVRVSFQLEDSFAAGFSDSICFFAKLSVFFVQSEKKTLMMRYTNGFILNRCNIKQKSSTGKIKLFLLLSLMFFLMQHKNLQRRRLT